MARFGPLVDAAWLAANRHEVDLRIADVRWYLDGRSGHDAYRSGHIPGAVFVELETALAAPPGRHGRHPLPEPATFAAAMSAAGIGDTTRVVAYDDTGGSTAARLWWMLTVTGHPAAVLDGGLVAWEGDLESGEASVAPAEFTPVPWPPSELVDAEVVGSNDDLILLDARAAERFRGETEPIDPRPGHIPGAVNAPWTDNLDPATKRFLSPAALRRHYGELTGGDGGREPVAYCGSGVTACHNLLALAIAGRHGRLYPGSWSEWSADPAHPAALGDS